MTTNTTTSASSTFTALCAAEGMSVLDMLSWVDQFRWFPRSHRHCPKSFRGRNLKRYGWYGFHECGQTYNMDTVENYADAHDLSVWDLVRKLDAIVPVMEDAQCEWERMEWEENYHRW